MMLDAGPLVTTFSIVGYDPQEQAWGIAVASRFLAVGAKTCWGEGEAGVAVIQAYLNARNGSRAVELLREGVAAGEVIQRLLADDPYPELRQMAIIDRTGGVAAHTGDGCSMWAGHVVGPHCAAQGNMLVSGEGCAAMVEQFAQQRGSLARRLVAALATGDRVGGDARGRQSSALFVVRPSREQPFDVFNEPTIDLRVDDSEEPFSELARLLDLHELIFLPTAPEERLPCDVPTVMRLQRVLARLSYYSGEITGQLDDATTQAMKVLGRQENFHRRLASTDSLDRRLLDHLEALASRKERRTL